MEVFPYVKQFDILPTDIAFTWSPDPSLFYKIYEPERQHQSCYSYLYNLRLCSNFLLSLELTQQGNIHYHALIRLTDKVKWYKKVLPTFRKNGNVKIKTGNTNSKWIEYICKDKKIYEKVFNLKLPLTINDFPKLTKAKHRDSQENPLDFFDKYQNEKKS